MACRLVGAKPLSEPMLPCRQLDNKKHIFIEIVFKMLTDLKEMFLKCRLQIRGHFVQGR